MVFSSITFLFFFLPAVIAIYYVAPKRARNLVLLVASLLFYLWGAGWLILLLVGSTAANYFFGNWIERAVDAGDAKRARAVLAIAVIMNVGLLIWFKYAGFASASLAGLLQGVGVADFPVLSILLPIGISFYTFHSLSYLIDIYRGTARHLPRPVDFALYIAFFPQLIAGPIVRFHEIRDQLLERSESASRFAHGVYRFGHGLFKKVVIADSIAPTVNIIFTTPPDQLNTLTALLGVAGFGVQLYFDFSGYTDMALGIAEMFGLRLPENFDRPYASRSFTEFWRRWHMSLGRWFRDYLYIPLGGSRGSERRTYFNLGIVFVLVGMWHGAGWTFLLFGAYHGLLIIIERRLGIGRDQQFGARAVLAQARTFVLLLFGFIIFLSPDVGHAIGYTQALFRPSGGLLPAAATALGPLGLFALVVGAASLLLPRDWVTGVRLEFERSRRAGLLRLATATVSMPMAFVLLIAGTFSPFLYFQF